MATVERSKFGLNELLALNGAVLSDTCLHKCTFQHLRLGKTLSPKVVSKLARWRSDVPHSIPRFAVLTFLVVLLRTLLRLNKSKDNPEQGQPVNEQLANEWTVQRGMSEANEHCLVNSLTRCDWPTFYRSYTISVDGQNSLELGRVEMEVFESYLKGNDKIVGN